MRRYTPAPQDIADDEPISTLPPADKTGLPGEVKKKPKIGIISLCDHNVDSICSASVGRCKLTRVQIRVDSAWCQSLILTWDTLRSRFGFNFNLRPDTSVANKQAYADRHGYDVIVDSEIIDESRPTSWSKLLAMRKYLPSYDFLFYVDVDTIITNTVGRCKLW